MRPRWLVCSWESDRILSKAAQLGQTGKHFMWILSKSAIGDRTRMAPPSFYPGLLGNSSTVIRSDTIRCYFNVRSKADMSQLNLPHGNDN